MKKRDRPPSEKRASSKIPAVSSRLPLERELSRVASSQSPPEREPERDDPDDYARGSRPLPPRTPRVPPPASSPRDVGDLGQRGFLEAAPSFTMRSDENSVEGTRVGFERRLRELARGLFPVFDTLDLHGMTAEKAEAAVRSFCTGARGQVPRTVLIIHGKGIHSPAGQAILRDAVAHWLSTAPLARDVLCFVTARPKHGGAGAMYVLLAARPPSAGNTGSGPQSRRPRG